MGIMDFIPEQTPADNAWTDLGTVLGKCIDEAIEAGDANAAGYFSSQRGSPSVYVPFGFKIAQKLGVDMDVDAFVSSRGKGFEHHKRRIRDLVGPCNVRSLRFSEKCGLDLCFAHPTKHNVTFAYEAEMSKIPRMPDSAFRQSSCFSEDAEKRFYLEHLNDLDKLLQIDSPQLLYLGCVGNNGWEEEVPKLRLMIQTLAQRTLEASCFPRRTLTVLLTTGRKRKVSSQLYRFHRAVGVWSGRAFSWSQA